MVSIKTQEAATAVAFASSDSKEYVNVGNIRHKKLKIFHRRRILAVGLETGEIHIYCGTLTNRSKWDLEMFLDSRHGFSRFLYYYYAN